jgi:hypothetical protein
LHADERGRRTGCDRDNDGGECSCRHATHHAIAARAADR